MDAESPRSGIASRWIVLIVVAVVCLGAGYALGVKNGHSSPEAFRGPGGPGGAPSPTPLDLVGKKLSDTSVANFAYLISADTLTDDAKTALTGFILSHAAQTDGSVTYTLKANNPSNPEYQNQTYTVKQGQQLYFIEMSPRDDDTSDNTDANTHDDHAVVVDANGIVVSQ